MWRSRRPTGGALRQLMLATAVSAALGAAHAPALQEVVDRFAALQSALGSFDGFAGNFARAVLVGLELHQAGGDHFRQVALLVALGHFDGLVNLALAQSSRNGGGERTRLVAGRVKSHPAI